VIKKCHLISQTYTYWNRVQTAKRIPMSNALLLSLDHLSLTNNQHVLWGF